MNINSLRRSQWRQWQCAARGPNGLGQQELIFGNWRRRASTNAR